MGFRGGCRSSCVDVTGLRLGYLNPRRSGLQRAVRKKPGQIARIRSVSSVSWVCRGEGGSRGVCHLYNPLLLPLGNFSPPSRRCSLMFCASFSGVRSLQLTQLAFACNAFILLKGTCLLSNPSCSWLSGQRKGQPRQAAETRLCVSAELISLFASAGVNSPSPSVAKIGSSPIFK